MEDVPAFPKFKVASLTDEVSYRKFYSQFEPYSDFSFNNLWVWFNRHDDLAFSWHNGNLIIKLGNPFDDGAEEYTLLGKHDCRLTIQRLFRWQKAMGLSAKIVMVPQAVLDHAGPWRRTFHCTLDIDNQDYVIDVAAAFEAFGKKYMKYRNAIRNFAKNNASISTREVDLSVADESEKVRLVNSLHSWDFTYRQSDQANLEGASIDRCLRYAGPLKWSCLEIFVEQQLVAFIIYHFPPQPEYVLGNYLRCDYSYHNVYDFAFSKFIEMLHQRGIRYANIEQDLGIPGIRIHKQKANPTRFLKRYTLTP